MGSSAQTPSPQKCLSCLPSLCRLAQFLGKPSSYKVYPWGPLGRDLRVLASASPYANAEGSDCLERGVAGHEGRP